MSFQELQDKLRRHVSDCYICGVSAATPDNLGLCPVGVELKQAIDEQKDKK